MKAWNMVLLVLSFVPLLMTIYYVAMFIAQGRKHWRHLNYFVIVASLIVFAHSCWQISFFVDESFYLLMPFPQDYFSHTYLFVIPTVLAAIAIPKMYPDLSKILYACLILSAILACLALFAYPGKDLIWFSISLSILLIFIGLKEDQFTLYYRHFVKYLFLENTWVALFYFKNPTLFFIALVLQTMARFYFFQFLNLFWIQSFLKKNIINKTEQTSVGGLIKG